MTKKVKLIVGCQAITKPDIEIVTSVKNVVTEVLAQGGYLPENIKTNDKVSENLTFVEVSADIEVVNSFSTERKSILNSLMESGRHNIDTYVGWLVQIENRG